MMVKKDDTVIVFGPEGIKEGEKGLFGQVREGLKPVSLEKIRDNFQRLMSALGEALKDLPLGLGAYQIQEIELACEIDVEGEVRLIGGIKTGAKGGVTVKLQRTSGT